METTTPNIEGPQWPAWRKIGFRFAFIYLLLYTAPWTFVQAIPGFSFVGESYDVVWDWIVRTANAHLFHVTDYLVPVAGSGDTSFAWAQLLFTLLAAFIGCILWSLLDRRRTHYGELDYWLRLTVRYYIAYFCLLYGIIKVFALQMTFPNISALATSLGDFLPMRLSWMFVGYSTPYQVFSGIMECTAGLLLLNGRTVTLGLITATGVFMHVVVLNLSYDIPVKLFSIHLLLYCLYLLSYELKRLLGFFVFNRVTEPDTSFNMEFRTKWARYGRFAGKLAFIILAAIVPLLQRYDYYKSLSSAPELKPIKRGMYDVDLFVLNGRDTVPALVGDSLRWNDMVFEGNGFGSIKTVDTLFRQRYRRGYFFYQPDTVKQVLNIWKSRADTPPMMTMKYNLPDENTIQLWTKFKSDSLYVRLRRSKRHFQLTEKQFHWLSEDNR
ncbi:MAG TPA: hypothetical protein VK508_08335 [Cyclobacteriaceae bacterium]|nr:hypothetical protein [Cyclobacteriaceae bacterium]